MRRARRAAEAIRSAGPLPPLAFPNGMSADATTRRLLLDFELALDAAICDEVVEEEWGRAFLTPGLPHVWDASFIALEQTGMSAVEVAALADRVLGGAGFIHRTVAVCDDVDGRRLLGEGLPSGWKAERNAYMAWTTDSGRRSEIEVAAVTPAEIASLRRTLIKESMSPGLPALERTVDELLDLDSRYDAPAGDLWFAAPADDPAAACRLLIQGEVGQIEDVATLESARGRGLAQAVVLAALEHSRTAGHQLTFLTADADDWPLELYSKLGFRAVGEVQILRRH